MRVRKVALESQVQALSGQYRLVQAASNKNGVRIDPSRLAEAERLVGQIRQQLNVAGTSSPARPSSPSRW